MKLKSQRIIVSGAGSGIGEALCQELAAESARLCLVDQRREHLEPLLYDIEALAENAIAMACDVTRPDHRQAALREIEKAWGGVDVLINLAGAADIAPSAEDDPAMMRRILKAHVEAPMQFARAVLPRMTRQGAGRIVNIGPVFGGNGSPAARAAGIALRSFSQTLRRELHGTGVGVTYVAAPALRTGLHPPVPQDTGGQQMTRTDEPAWIAHKIIAAIAQDRREVYFGVCAGLLARINAVLPRAAERALGRPAPALPDVAFSREF